MKRLLLPLMILAMSGAADRGRADGADFSSYWHDGKAELSGYRLFVGF